MRVGTAVKVPKEGDIIRCSSFVNGWKKKQCDLCWFDLPSQQEEVIWVTSKPGTNEELRDESRADALYVVVNVYDTDSWKQGFYQVICRRLREDMTFDVHGELIGFLRLAEWATNTKDKPSTHLMRRDPIVKVGTMKRVVTITFE